MNTSQSVEDSSHEEHTQGEALPIQPVIKNEEEVDYTAETDAVETEEVETGNLEAEHIEATHDDGEQLVEPVESKEAAVNIEFQGMSDYLCTYIELVCKLWYILVFIHNKH